MSRWSGADGETAAAEHLRRLGFKLVARNLRTRHAEIDLLVRRRRLYVAVEVKSRRHHPAPERAVAPRQLDRISTALRALAPRLRPPPKDLRVDVIAVTPPCRSAARELELRHFEGVRRIAPGPPGFREG